MRTTFLLILLLGICFSSCYEDAPCRDFRIEVKGEGAIDSVYYSFWGNGTDADDDFSGAVGPSEVPLSIPSQFCGSNINYLVNVYMADSNANFLLQVYADDSLRSESNEVIRKYYEGTQYRWALESVGVVLQ